jgi:hypothetical protein
LGRARSPASWTPHPSSSACGGRSFAPKGSTGWRICHAPARHPIYSEATDNEHIDAFIESYNEDAEPFVWTKSKVHQRRVKGRRLSDL